jgi:hypothetical protein
VAQLLRLQQVQLLLCGMSGNVGMRRTYGSCSGAAHVAWAGHCCAILLDGFRVIDAAAMLMLHCAFDMLPCIFGTSTSSVPYIRCIRSSSCEFFKLATLCAAVVAAVDQSLCAAGVAAHYLCDHVDCDCFSRLLTRAAAIYSSSCMHQYLLLMVDLHPYSMLHSMHAWQQELPAPQHIGVVTCFYSGPLLVAHKQVQQLHCCNALH